MRSPIRIFLVGCLALIGLALDVQAGGWCNRSHYHTLSHTGNWSQSCWSCHTRKSDSKELVTRLAEKKVEWEGIVNGIRELGFVPSGSANLQGAPGSSMYGEMTYSPQGSTVYGYSNFTNNYGTDIDALFNMASRHTANAQTLAGDATAKFAALVELEGANQAEVASILAQGQAAERALLAARGQSTQAVMPSSFRFKIETDGSGGWTVQPEGTSEDSDSVGLGAVLDASCVSCHSSDKPAKGLDLSETARNSWDAETTAANIDKMIARVVHSDPTKRMPLGADGQPGHPLNPQEIGKFYEAKLNLRRK